MTRCLLSKEYINSISENENDFKLWITNKNINTVKFSINRSYAVEKDGVRYFSPDHYFFISNTNPGEENLNIVIPQEKILSYEKLETLLDNNEILNKTILFVLNSIDNEFYVPTHNQYVNTLSMSTARMIKKTIMLTANSARDIRYIQSKDICKYKSDSSIDFDMILNCIEMISAVSTDSRALGINILLANLNVFEHWDLILAAISLGVNNKSMRDTILEFKRIRENSLLNVLLGNTGTTYDFWQYMIDFNAGKFNNPSVSIDRQNKILNFFNHESHIKIIDLFNKFNTKFINDDKVVITWNKKC